MIAPDVHVLVDAWNPHNTPHLPAREWLGAQVAAQRPLAVSELVLSEALRVLTMPGVHTLGHDAGAVLALVDELLAAPGVVRLRPGSRHWAIFQKLRDATTATGNHVPDCYHAALSIESGATWASRDGFFAGVPGLDWVRPY